jgi:hypothetical protein
MPTPSGRWPISKGLVSGVLEFVSWNIRLCILLQPCRAVPKGKAPFYRLITDARFANKLCSDWVSRTPLLRSSTAR